LELVLEVIDLVTEAAAAVAHLGVSDRDIRVQASLPTVWVTADRQRIGQVMTNLLTNAIKYSPEGGEIVVLIDTEADRARVAISDRGVGIPAEALPHLFDRFYRVTETTNTASGLGLGLYISRRIVEAHDGSIEVASHLGQGSTFTILLPLERV
jgi:signal transduction histidine kinase